ncbi:cytochrome c oxidase assembly protein [Rhodovibrio salinarum]|uniref:Cytochrome c oxidase assembly protein n=1 Tax=Rhodovibrio salinarum TaxID=1087 RepID=A0A934V0E6_9PROT|nr:cytochrome c oxidase assembly protein [Rhodovibrio salinarum]MBK1697768.1 cytochrome c oxidase assembly protein [Rhodovibrio salinarum]
MALTAQAKHPVAPRPRDAVSAGVYAAILLGGVGLWYVARAYPADMPAVGPYTFYWPVWLATTLSAFWYLRGLRSLAPERRPAVWRRLMFLLGLLALYAAVHTGFEYVAQRMFFLNRAQHVVMHHLGPLLLALSAAGPVILAGGPRWLARLCAHSRVQTVFRWVQQPVIAGVLFVGLFFFWLIPPVHFVAMLDPLWYRVMNWSMILDGILFWALVLDRRPAPPARTGFAARAVLAVAVMFPQIVGGALITFAPMDLFPYYAFCGRLYPSIGPLTDQQYGGLIIWLPPAMMSVIALLVVLANLRRAEAAGR